MCNAVLENFGHVNEIKSYLLDSEFSDHDLIIKLQHIEDKLNESTPNMDDYNKKYDKKRKEDHIRKTISSNMLSYFVNVCLPSSLSNNYFITLSI